MGIMLKILEEFFSCIRSNIYTEIGDLFEMEFILEWSNQ